jgi:putative phosphoserine phosphatase / 1-acylglycerol-3-phosphate O-acyltransferase
MSAMTSGTDRQMRLPGSVAEIDASPKGPEIGAFFDMDGTLVAGYTAAAHTMEFHGGSSAPGNSCG